MTSQLSALAGGLSIKKAKSYYSLIRENVNGKINKIGKIGLDFWNFQFFTFTFF